MLAALKLTTELLFIAFTSFDSKTVGQKVNFFAVLLLITQNII